MENKLERGDFLSLFGFDSLWDELNASGASTHAVIATDLEEGTIRSLLLRATKEGPNEYRVGIKYLCHTDPYHNDVEDIIELGFRSEGAEIILSNARVRDQDIDLNTLESTYNLSLTYRTFAKAIVGNNDWVNPVAVLEENGWISSAVGQKSWPGLYASGDFKSMNEGRRVDSDVEPVLPALFLPAILGVGREGYGDKTQNTRTLSTHGKNQNDETQTCLLSYNYEEKASPQHLNLSATVAVHSSLGAEKETLYEVKTRPYKEDSNLTNITHLSFMGRKIDLKNQEALGTTLKAIRNINRLIRAGDQAVIEDLKKSPQNRRLGLPSELALHLGLFPHLNQDTPPPKKGLLSYVIVGGSNVGSYISKSDENIGANQSVAVYEYNDDLGIRRKEALMIDAGILFHDIFDSAFFNPASYFHHAMDKRHVPDTPVKAIMFTHRHKDHLGQLAQLVKAGYDLPVLVLSKMGQLQLERDMRELKIDKEIRKQIQAKCYAIDLLQDIDPQNPETRKSTTIAGTTIEQWTETLPGKDLGRTEYYPILQIGSFTVRCGPMPHSDPGLMFDFITPAGSLRHTGDYKLDSTIKLGLPPLDVWAQGFTPDALSADSTGATREIRNPTEQEVQDSIQSLLEENADKRFIFPILGSNIARLTTTIAALGEADTNRKTLIIDGKAVNDLVRDSDKVFGLKKWAKDTYGINILFWSQKTKVADFINDPARDSEYAYLVSGTQDEAYSSLNRAVRDDLPLDRYSISDNDLICFLQGVIPTGENAFRRLDVKEYVEKYHNALVYLPEIIEKEGNLWLHSSGHNDRKGMGTMIEWSGKPCVLPVHGGPAQLQAHHDIARSVGATSHAAIPSQSLRIQSGKKVTPHQIVQAEMVGITLHSPSKDKFYLKGRFSTSIFPLKPKLDMPVAILLEQLEDNLHAHAGIVSPYEMAKTLPISLSKKFNALAPNHFLSQKISFGIDKYGGDVFEEKNIHAIGGFDTETGGLDASAYAIRELALTIQNTQREAVESFQLFQQIPDYRMPSVQALLVTNTDPYTLEDGIPGPDFAQQTLAAIKKIKETSHEIAQKKLEKEKPGTKIKKTEVKALCVAHNARYDNRFLFREMIRNLVMDSKPTQTRGTISIDTRNISRALFAYAPQKYSVPINPESGLPDHRLSSACEANNIKVDETKTHGGDYDTALCLDLFWHQYDLAPDIVGQMILNSDSTTNHLLNDMRGVDTGFNGPHPVFSYISPDARRSKPQMGSLIGTLNDDRYAVIFNLKYDPNDYLHMSEDQISAFLADRDSDVFELVDLKQQPIIMPARFGLRLKANGKLPKETLDVRAGTIRRHLNYVDPHAQWQTLPQKLNAAWKKRTSEIFKARLSDQNPDLHETPMHMWKDIPTPDKSALDLWVTHNSLGFNNAYQYLHKNLREYLNALKEEDTSTASTLYKTIRKERLKYPQAMDAINNVHYDVAKADLTPDDLKRIEAIREIMRFKNYHAVIEGLEEIDNKPEVYARYVGDDEQKQILLSKIKEWATDNTDCAYLSTNAKRLLHPWSNLTRGDRSHDNDDDDPGPTVSAAVG